MEHKNKKSRNISKKKKWILIFDGVLFLGLIIAIIVLTSNLNKPKQPGSNAPTQQASNPAAPESTDAPDLATPATNQGAAAAQTYASALKTDASGQLTGVDFAALAEQGVNAAAWLYSPGTPINYPVMQALDNEHYMTRNELDKKDKNGAIYLDCRNTKELSDAQIMIYGNPMADGSMFGSLVEYRSQAYFTEHPTLMLFTPEGRYRIDVFAARTASPAMSNYPTWFETDSARARFVSAIQQGSLIQSDLTIASNATLITLVTCSDFDAGEDSRFVVHGVLVKE